MLGPGGPGPEASQGPSELQRASVFPWQFAPDADLSAVTAEIKEPCLCCFGWGKSQQLELVIGVHESLCRRRMSLDLHHFHPPVRRQCCTGCLGAVSLWKRPRAGGTSGRTCRRLHRRWSRRAVAALGSGLPGSPFRREGRGRRHAAATALRPARAKAGRIGGSFFLSVLCLPDRRLGSATTATRLTALSLFSHLFPPSPQEHFDETAVAAAASQGPRACVEELAARLPSHECFWLSHWRRDSSAPSSAQARLVFSHGRKAGDQTAQRVQMQRASAAAVAGLACVKLMTSSLIRFGCVCCGVNGESCADALNIGALSQQESISMLCQLLSLSATQGSGGSKHEQAAKYALGRSTLSKLDSAS